jgi:hypothetical protein
VYSCAFFAPPFEYRVAQIDNAYHHGRHEP